MLIARAELAWGVPVSASWQSVNGEVFLKKRKVYYSSFCGPC